MQKSIADSVLQLLTDTIDRLGLQSFFEVQTTQILGKNGSRFLFEGIKQNISKIKSMEGIDICWCEEADQITETSWNILTPTIRKPGSEIYLTFNPADINDFIYQRFVINPPRSAYVSKVNYTENPFFPKELDQERLHMMEENPTLYRHIWLGEPIANREGAYYHAYIEEEQIQDFQIQPNLACNSYWDLGMADSTSIWIEQTSPAGEVRLVHTYENHGKGLQHYINYLNDWRDRHKIVFNYHYAPHDIAVRELGTGVSRLETARQLGINFQVAPKLPILDGINAARQLLPRCWFHKTHTHDGLRALRSYRREFDEKNNTYKDKPLHDWSSHYADAFRTLATCYQKANNTFTEPVTAPDWSIF
jgi:phage terminase large subunit